MSKKNRDGQNRIMMANNNIATEVRYDFVDFLKGVGIFLVVWGHTMVPRSIYIYSFHMPLFFFLSGFLHKGKPIRQFIIGKINSLYIPYAVFTLLSWFFYLWRQLARKDHSGLSTHYYKLTSIVTGTADNGGNNPIWFLTCLLVVSCGFLLISQIKNAKFRPWVVLGVSLIGYLLSLTRINLFFNIDIACSAIVFYYLGFSVRRRNLLDYIDSVRRWVRVLALIPAIIAQLGAAYLNVTVAPIRWVNMAGNNLGNYFLFYTAACLGIFVYLVIGYWIQKIRLINFLGKNSLLILATHKPMLLLFNLYVGKFLDIQGKWHGLLATIVVLAVSIPLILLVNRWVPLLIGKKPVLKILE